MILTKGFGVKNEILEYTSIHIFSTIKFTQRHLKK
jgi:hypothetical protein